MPIATVWSRSDVRILASAQHGLITAAQLADLGVPKSTVSRSNSLGGMISWVLPGVHRIDGRGVMPVDQRDMAALLYAGVGAVLTGCAALLRLSLRAATHPALNGHDRVHLLVHHSRTRSSHGFVMVERTVCLPEPRLRDGFPLAPTGRAVLDAARRCPDENAVRALVFEAVQRGLVSAESLDRERRAGQIRGSRFARLAIDEALGGARSIPEGDVRAVFVAAGWTRLLYNPRLYLVDGTFVGCPDVYDPETGVCLDVDSREFHFDPDSWEATMRRHGRMTAAGLAVLHVPPSRAGREPDDVVAEFEAATQARRGWPPPLVVAR